MKAGRSPYRPSASAISPAKVSGRCSAPAARSLACIRPVQARAAPGRLPFAHPRDLANGGAETLFDLGDGVVIEDRRHGHLAAGPEKDTIVECSEVEDLDGLPVLAGLGRLRGMVLQVHAQHRAVAG